MTDAQVSMLCGTALAIGLIWLVVRISELVASLDSRGGEQTSLFGFDLGAEPDDEDGQIVMGFDTRGKR